MKAKVILVEGVTDAFLLAHVFIGEKNYRRIPDPSKASIVANPDYSRYEWCEYLQSPHQETLLIFACGSCSRFHECYETYFRYNAEEGRISHLAIVRDADKKQEIEYEADITNAFASKLKFSLRKWEANTLMSSEFPSSNSCSVQSYLLVVPPNEKGILEDAVLQALAARKDDNSVVVSCAKNYVESVKERQQKYVQTYRLQHKAMLSAAFAVIEPSHGFQNTEAFFKSVRWKNFPRLIAIFADLLSI